MIKNLSILFFLCISTTLLYAQDTLRLSRAESEALFLKENLQLLAEEINISQAEAQVIQAKLWPNPELSIEEVNLWKKGNEDFAPPISGSFGKNQQFSIEVEQLIITAGKRKKQIALEDINVEQAKHYFEDVLRNLKIEFRSQLTKLQYLQRSKSIYQEQYKSISQLAKGMQNQVNQGFVSRSDYIRLKAEELSFLKEVNTLNQDLNAAQKELKQLMHLAPTTRLHITEEGYLKNRKAIENLALKDLASIAQKNRPDLELADLEKEYAEQSYSFEKAQRIPDIALKAGYDRAGGVIPDFIGFGLSIDLPIFDRNQGHIKIAQQDIQKADLLQRQKLRGIENEITMVYDNLQQALAFYQNISDDYEAHLDTLLKAHTKNFKDKNINLLTYLDFLEAYLNNKIIMLEAVKTLNDKAETLNYTLGTDLIK